VIPKPPPREGSLGFLYVPPYRIQGFSVAGEWTAIQVPELDVCFDIGACPRPMLTSKYIAITHGHMDHVGGLAYYFSQRQFQGMGTGTALCHPELAPALQKMMDAWVDIELQQTPHTIQALAPGEDFMVKNNIYLRGFEVDHTAPSLGYTIIERRTKLRDEYVGLPQSRLLELKESGHEITRELRIPLVTFTGDTFQGEHLLREEIRTAKIVIMECTFFEPDHKPRAKIGKHLHVEDVAELLPHLAAEVVVLVHLSRRTNLGVARRQLTSLLSTEDASRVLFLMDHKHNRQRYERQAEEAARLAGAADASSSK
jgi:ribonuclease Z